jgi:hypothetical protein
VVIGGGRSQGFGEARPFPPFVGSPPAPVPDVAAIVSMVGLRPPGADRADPPHSRVTGSQFSLLGVSAAVGRMLTEEDQREGAPSWCSNTPTGPSGWQRILPSWAPR